MPKDKDKDITDNAIVVTNDKLMGMWYIAHIPNADFLQALYQLEDGKFEIRCRFKYYNSLQPFDPLDERSMFRAVTSKPTTREEAIELARGAVETLSKLTGQKIYEILVHNGDLDKFMEEVRKQEWTHSASIH